MPWEVVSSLTLSIPRETWKKMFRDNKRLSAQFQHVEMGWGQGFLTPISVASPGSHLCFWLTSYRLEVPTIPFLDSFNLLEHLTEIIKVFYILYHQFVLKRFNSGRARWLICMGQGIWKGAQSFHGLQGCHSSWLSRVHHMKILWTHACASYGGFII